MRSKSVVSNDQLAVLISEGHENSRARLEDLKKDFDQKHEENRERRHALGNKLGEVEGRVALVESRTAVLETKIYAVVGDSSGGSGLLHEIKSKVEEMRGEVSSSVEELQRQVALIKQTVQDTPTINKWIYGVMAVLGFLAIVVPVGLTILFGMLEVIFRFWKH